MSRLWKHKFELKPGCWVFVPEEETIQEGKKIKQAIESSWSPPDYYFHLSEGGHVAAMRSHLKSDIFIRADIHQFFNKINKSRITRNLKRIFRSYKIASNFTEKSVVRFPNSDPKRYILPFGFVQSAIIASLCLRLSYLGKFLDLLRKRGLIVSVYMDDIIISSKLPLTEMQKIYTDLMAMAKKSGFELNLDKMKGPCNSATAFNIVLSHDEMIVSEQRMLDFKNAIAESTNEFQIEGILGYVKTVCPIQEAGLRT